MQSDTESTPGRLEGLVDGVAIGWIGPFNTSSSNTRPIVEICCDGYPVAYERADIFRGDLRDQVALDDYCCGFAIALPKAALRLGRRITARLANTLIQLAGELALGDGKTVQRHAAHGEVSLRGGLTLGGWVQAREYQPDPVKLQFFEGEQLLGETLALDPLPKQEEEADTALVKLFELRLPLSLADGQLHQITVKTDKGAELKGSPVTVAAWQLGPEAVLREIAECRALPVQYRETLLTLAAASTRVGAVLPTAISFADYPAWRALAASTACTDPHHANEDQAAEGQAVGDQSAEGEPVKSQTTFTVVLYGRGDYERSTASLNEQGVPLTLISTEDGQLDQSEWPSRGVVALLRSGDTLIPGALVRLAALLENAVLAYSDSEQQLAQPLDQQFSQPFKQPGSQPEAPAGTHDPAGLQQTEESQAAEHWLPWLKPDWDPDLFLGQGYVFGLLALRADAVQLGLGRHSVLALAVTALASHQTAIAHLPQVLYRQYGASALGQAPVEPEAFRHSLRCWPDPALRSTEPLQAMPWLHRLHWVQPSPPPRVSVIVPTRDRLDLLERAIETLLRLSRYPSIELIVVDNGSTCAQTLEYLDTLLARGISVLRQPGPFNFSALNNAAVAEASGELLCLLNNDVEIVDGHWLTEMVALLMREGTGVVGAKLLWQNDLVQHGGVILGMDGGAQHVGNRWLASEPGYAGRNLLVQRYSAVTAACLLLRRSDYIEVGGLDEKAFPVNFNDVDLCLKIGALGKAVVWTPHAVLRHHESASRGGDELPERIARARRELDNLRERWGQQLLDDPAYNPSLNRDGVPFRGLTLPVPRTAPKPPLRIGGVP